MPRLKYALTACVCLVLLAANSQENSRKPHFGVSISPQLSSIRFDTEELKKSKTGLAYTFDGSLLFDLTKKLQVQGGISFQKAIIRQRDYSPAFPSDLKDGVEDLCLSYYEFKFDYISFGLPLGIRVKLGDKPNHFLITGSGHLRQIIRSREEFLLNESGIVMHQIETNQFGVEVDKTQFFVGGGFGYDFGLKTNRRLSIGPAFEYSLKDILKVKPNDPAPDYIGGNPVFTGLRIFYY